MKIICIGRNYIHHVKELNNPIPVDPVFFLKPDSALLINNQPFYYPDFSSDIQYEVEIVLKINRLGKNIAPEFAHRYFNEVGIGIDFTARDLQRNCIEKGLPWEIAKAFDKSAVLGKFIQRTEIKLFPEINFQLAVNNQVVQKGNTRDMIFSFDKIIAYVSQFMTLKIGDLIFTGTPSGVGPVKIGDNLQAYIEDKLLLNFKIK